MNGISARATCPGRNKPRKPRLAAISQSPLKPRKREAGAPNRHSPHFPTNRRELCGPPFNKSISGFWNLGYTITHTAITLFRSGQPNPVLEPSSPMLLGPALLGGMRAWRQRVVPQTRRYRGDATTSERYGWLFVLGLQKIPRTPILRP